ncbi:MAG TPA: GTPase ObgE, partial [Thermoanaerobaculia bacterium]|nr:GTPase ObgE [Thermoanaerobaculia bacterium]
LAAFDPRLAARERVLVASKREMSTPEQIAAVTRAARRRGKRFFAISAAAHQGLEPLVAHLGARLEETAA